MAARKREGMVRGDDGIAASRRPPIECLRRCTKVGTESQAQDAMGSMQGKARPK
jgi:hypothetical protein